MPRAFLVPDGAPRGNDGADTDVAAEASRPPKTAAAVLQKARAQAAEVETQLRRAESLLTRSDARRAENPMRRECLADWVVRCHALADVATKYLGSLEQSAQSAPNDAGERDYLASMVAVAAEKMRGFGVEVSACLDIEPGSTTPSRVEVEISPTVRKDDPTTVDPPRMIFERPPRLQ